MRNKIKSLLFKFETSNKKKLFSKNLPKNIYFFWNDGFDNLPPLVELCIKLWEKLNPDFNIIKLDNKDLKNALQELNLEYLDIPIQHLSDILRVYILSNKGGIWADATVLPILPLNRWLPEAFEEDFFAFRCHHAPYCLISNWFFVSSPEHLITKTWLDEIKNYWNRTRKLYMDPRNGNPTPENPIFEIYMNKDKSDTYPYFCHHYLFTGMILKNDNLRKIWDSVKPISSTPLHQLQNYMRMKMDLDEEEVLTIIEKSVVEKLDWRLKVNNLDLIYNLVLKKNGKR